MFGFKLRIRFWRRGGKSGARHTAPPARDTKPLSRPSIPPQPERDSFQAAFAGQCRPAVGVGKGLNANLQLAISVLWNEKGEVLRSISLTAPGIQVATSKATGSLHVDYAHVWNARRDQLLEHGFGFSAAFDFGSMKRLVRLWPYLKYVSGFDSFGFFGAYSEPVGNLQPVVGIWFSPFGISSGSTDFTYNPYLYTFDLD